MQLLSGALAMAVMLSAVSLALGAASTIVLDDTDWRPSGAVSHSEGVERDMTPEVLLKTEFRETVFLFDPTSPVPLPQEPTHTPPNRRTIRGATTQHLSSRRHESATSC